MSRRAWLLWSLVFLGALLTALNALVLMVLPPEGRGPFAERFHAAPLLGWAHAGGGALAIVLGALQWLRPLRLRYPGLHRWLGRCYLAAVAVSALAGLYFAASSFGGPVGGLGFALAAVAWLATGALAWERILRGNVSAHQRWMLRNYAITCAAVTLRLMLPLLFVTGLDPVQVFQIVAWASWVLNLLLVELWLISRRRSLSLWAPVVPRH